MAQAGRESTELGIHTPAAKFLSFFAKQLHQLPNVSGCFHEGKVLQGDWHSIGSVRQWTYTLDGKVETCKENVEAIDEQNKSATFNLFDGDISTQYKTLKSNLKLTDKDKGGAVAKWTLEYEKVREDIGPPFAYLDFVTKFTKDVDAYLIKA